MYFKKKKKSEITDTAIGKNVTPLPSLQRRSTRGQVIYTTQISQKLSCENETIWTSHTQTYKNCHLRKKIVCIEFDSSDRSQKSWDGGGGRLEK